MKEFAKLIHKSNITFLPTMHPVQFYGLPDGKVHFIYARIFKVGFDRSDLEFVFAEHEDFHYDYHKEELIPRGEFRFKAPLCKEMVDKPDPNFKIKKVHRSVHSYAEAYSILNDLAKNQLMQKEETPQIVMHPRKEQQSSIA